MPRPAPSAAKADTRRFSPGMLVTRQASQSSNDPYEFVMSTDDVDRMGDVVDVDGIDLRAFRTNPVALWNHDTDSPIGTWGALRKEGGKLIGKLTLAAEATSPLIDRLRQLIEQRILRAVSIGFRALKVEPTGAGSGLRFLKSELVECSLVSIPANAAALRVRSLCPHSADREIFTGQSGATGSSVRTRANQPSPQRRQLASADGAKAMPRTIAERITALQTRSASIDDELNAIQEAAANDDDRDFSADELASMEVLTTEKVAVTDNIKTLTQLENTLASKAEPAGAGAAAGAGRLRSPATPAREEKAGFMIGKLAAVTALSHITKQPVDRIIAQRYANDDRVAACMGYVQRAAVQIADTTTPGWAAELVTHDVAAFMADLTNVSVFAALRARASTVSVSLDGVGSITIPSRSNQGNLAGAWVGETGVIPVLQGTFAAAKLEPTKLAAITTFSKELMNASNETIESVLRAGLRDDTADVLDKNLLDNVAKRVGVRPAGLQVGANSDASGGPDSVAADLLAAVGPIIAANGGRDIVLIMNPQQALGLKFATNMLGLPAFPEVGQGNLAGYPLITSNNVPVGTVVVLDAADFASAAGVPDFTVSEEATLTMANADGTAPTQAITSGGVVDVPGQVGPDLGIKVAGGAVGAGTANVVAMSMFQQWAIALRMVIPVHWSMRRPGMVSVITGVDWGGTP